MRRLPSRNTKRDEVAVAYGRKSSRSAPGSPLSWANLGRHCLRENGVVEIESERTARDRELKMFGGLGRAGSSSAQVSVQKTDANLGHQAIKTAWTP